MLLKLKKPEMDDFEEETNLVLKEKYLENILKMSKFLTDKKKSSLNGRAIKRKGSGGVKGRTIKEKLTFLEPSFFSNIPKFQRPFTSTRGGGG